MVLLRRGLRLEYATLGWNVVGSAVVIAAAVTARSVALAGSGSTAWSRLRVGCRGLAAQERER
jgi:hypothetical protein